MRNVFSFGNNFICRSYTDVDPDETGIEISLDDNPPVFVGQIPGMSLPDEEDEEECICFDVEIQNWLEENYWDN
jgi:hypothetical protein